jgi:hypothetical protein
MDTSAGGSIVVAERVTLVNSQAQFARPQLAFHPQTGNGIRAAFVLVTDDSISSVRSSLDSVCDVVAEPDGHYAAIKPKPGMPRQTAG